MQTSQVSNPANVLSSPAPTGKHNDADSSAAPFDQVLSREIADRGNAPEAPKGKDAGNTTAAKQPAKNGSKPAESKPAAEGKQTEDTVNPKEVADAALQIPEDMLALVANLTQIAPPVTDTAEAAPLVQDTQVPIDAALVAAGAGIGVKTNDQLAAQLSQSGMPVQVSLALAQRKPDTALHALTSRTTAATQQLDPATTGKAEMQPATSAVDLADRGHELFNGTATTAASSTTLDFAATVKESLSIATTSVQPAQHVTLQAAQPLAANLTEKLTPPVGTPAWDQALGQKVVWMVAGEQQSASLTLNPPDLGPLQVVLSVSNSQANATFIAAQPEVRQALEAALPKLRDMLAEAGIQLGQANVNSGAPNQQSGGEQASQTPRHFSEADSRNDAPVHVGRVSAAASGQGLVDTFV